MDDKKPKIVEFQRKKNDDSSIPEKTRYLIQWRKDKEEEEVFADFIDPSYEGLILFANYITTESINIIKVVNIKEVRQIKIRVQ